MRVFVLLAVAVLAVLSCAQAPVRPEYEQYWTRASIAIHAATVLCQQRGIPAKYANFESKYRGSGSFEAQNTLSLISCLTYTVSPHEYQILHVFDLCEQSEEVASLRRLVQEDFRPEYTLGCPPDAPTDLPPSPVERAFDAMDAACLADGAKLFRLEWSRRDEFVVGIVCVIKQPESGFNALGVQTVTSSVLHVCDAHEDKTHLREALSSLKEFPIDCSKHESIAGIEARERGRQKVRLCLEQNLAEPERCGVVPGTELLP